MMASPASPLTPVAAFAKRNCPRVLTEEGANAYVNENPDFLRFFLQKTSQVQHGDSAQHVYCFIGCLFTKATPSIVVQHVPVEDFDLLTSHARQVLLKLAESEKWKVETHHHLLLDACASACVIPGFFQSMIAKESNESAFTALVKLVSLRMVQPLAFELLRFVERSTRPHRVIGGSDGVFQVLSELEACGALSQVFRAMVVPQPPFESYNDDLCLFVINLIEREPRIVGKKLRPGTATGDTLKSIVEASLSKSSLGHSTDNNVMNAIKRLYRSAVLVAGSRKAASRSKKIGTSPCSHCMKLADKIMYCARCRVAGYCGKECQVSAWPEHKKRCSSKYANQMVRNNSTKYAMVLAFLNNGYMEIMMELLQVTQEHGVTMNDVVLELDFFSNGANPGPATLGDFKLDAIERYTSGERPAKPDWNNVPIDDILRDLLKLYHMSVGAMLVIVRQADGSASIMRVPRTSMWSEEALSCFPLDEDEDTERLKSIVDWDDPSHVDFYMFRYISLKAHEMAGLGRQRHNDFFMQIQMLQEKRGQQNS